MSLAIKTAATLLNWVQIPSAQITVGSTMEEIDRAADYWKNRLINPDYVPRFRDWLLKEYPKHSVNLEAFEITDVPVTNALYRAYCEATSAQEPESFWNTELAGGDDHPVWGVTFREAKAFCRWYSEQVGYTVDLPSEAQWEYAAAGTDGREYPWGNEFEASRCNTVEAGPGQTTPVRAYEKGRSPFGLYDMGGNVEEWVDSLYVPYPGGELIEDDLVEAFGTEYRVLRGGSFACGGDLARVARRHGCYPNPLFRFTGFRLVRAMNQDLK
jgi:toxoflavin biosynthesis protein ToxD